MGPSNPNGANQADIRRSAGSKGPTDSADKTPSRTGTRESPLTRPTLSPSLRGYPQVSSINLRRKENGANQTLRSDQVLGATTLQPPAPLKAARTPPEKWRNRRVNGNKFIEH